MQVALEYDVETWVPPFPPRDLPEPTPDELTALIGLMPAGPAAEIVREIYDHAGASVPT